jgi:hypothetical protein
VNIKKINEVSSYQKYIWVSSMVLIFFLFWQKFDKLEIFLKKAKYAYTINKHINMLIFARKDRNKEKKEPF